MSKKPAEKSPDAEDESQTSPENQPQRVDEFDLASLVSDPVLLFIIQRLREGPIEIESLHKLLKAKFREMKKSPREYCDMLQQFNFLREYEFEKKHPAPDNVGPQFPQMNVGQKQKFYILIKDFYAIRKPPVEILELLEQTEIGGDRVKELRKEIEVFFKKYTASGMAGDDPDVIALFMDQKLLAAVSYLTKKIYKISEITTEFKEKWGTDPTKAFRELEAKNFVKIVPIPQKDEKWVILKTAVELQAVFPEYLIRSINQLMAEKKLDKDFALITLNHLKKYYLEFEKPDYLKKLVEKIGIIKKKIQELSAPTAGKRPDLKGVKAQYTQLFDIYKQIGDIAQLDAAEKEWSQLEIEMKKK